MTEEELNQIREIVQEAIDARLRDEDEPREDTETQDVEEFEQAIEVEQEHEEAEPQRIPLPEPKPDSDASPEPFSRPQSPAGDDLLEQDVEAFTQEIDETYAGRLNNSDTQEIDSLEPPQPRPPDEPVRFSGSSATQNVEVTQELNVTLHFGEDIAEQLARQLEPKLDELYERVRQEAEDQIDRAIIQVEQGRSIS